MFIAWKSMKPQNPSKQVTNRIIASLGLGFLGSVVRLIGYVGKDYNYYAMGVGHGLIGLATIIMMM